MAGAKENEVYIVLPADGAAGWNVSGIFFRDTVYFDRWDWAIDGAVRLSRVATTNLIDEYHALTQEDRSQAIGLRRQVLIESEGFRDRWTLTNTTSAPRTVTLSLSAQPRMIDIFAGRLTDRVEQVVEVEIQSAHLRTYRRIADDGVVHHATVSCNDALPEDFSWTFTLDPAEIQTLELIVGIGSSDYDGAILPQLPSYIDWRASFAPLGERWPAVAQAIDDLRTLLLATENGPYPAAGLPIFINFFGRDALITGMMILDWRPEILRTVLAFLSARQGQVIDPFREEEPGKILHEIRRGELSRTNRIPFGRYYGSIDSTPLFLMAAGAYLEAHDDGAFADVLAPAIKAATDWLTRHLDGLTGLATFEASGSGLTVQSWKDSANSMVDEHGQAAQQPLAVAEVQGYAYAALLTASRLMPTRATELIDRANALRTAFHQQFWLPELQTYAMALDCDMKPLRVLSSDPGHLLWCGIVPEDVAPALVATLMSAPLWSGWGLRTLGASEIAYNPVSYHNGSIWPHDTGLFAMGLARYGFDGELHIVATALLDLADASPGRQIPELISGFDRGEHRTPVPYTHANCPQAWAAATVVRMAAYVEASSRERETRR